MFIPAWPQPTIKGKYTRYYKDDERTPAQSCETCS